ncbi:MAG TPA: TIGR01212 family radical SAM protein [Acidiferrobacter sp.]|nr:TIGR01212 family radical SAM protein [Acidiferrobacter sp.]
MAVLSEFVETFGQHLLHHFGERVHKVAIDAGFTCPNRDGARGRGGCTFCNNKSFHPKTPASTIADQVKAGMACVVRRTGARKVIAYFQTYTNTYAPIDTLAAAYDEALSVPGVVGLSIGTRPDCLSEPIVALLASYQAKGLTIWVELGLQSSFDETLLRVNRGHGFSEYCWAVALLRRYQLPVCTHMIIGLPGENRGHALETLSRVLALGVAGLKLHPLHVVRGSRLAHDWRAGEFKPLTLMDYVETVADLIERTPRHVVFHRLTGTAKAALLLAPGWCSGKWRVLNAITAELARRGTYQGALALGGSL